MMWRFNPQYIMSSIWAQIARRKSKKMTKDRSCKSDVQAFVKKSWGSEIWFANNEKYCGKLLEVESEKWSSSGKFHYHLRKDETFFVVQGRLWLDIGDDLTGEYQRLHLYENDSYRVMPGFKHRFSAASEYPCKFVEASTHHDDSDTYRCYYDGERGEWIDV
jgi:mannose-6-phosphate isomerase-like protein (cupin superfamily)